jgi:hypothetical protein
MCIFTFPHLVKNQSCVSLITTMEFSWKLGKVLEIVGGHGLCLCDHDVFCLCIRSQYEVCLLCSVCLVPRACCAI